MTAPAVGTARLLTLLASDLVDSTRLIERLGDERAAELFRKHDRRARDLLAAHGGREIDKTDGFLLTFERPTDALLYALAYHDALRVLGEEAGVPLEARIGIHVGELVVRENTTADVARGAKPIEVEGLAKSVAARVMSLAIGRQTLLTRAPFELARRGAVGTRLADGTLSWLAHGAYHAQGIDDPLEVFEVGPAGLAPLVPPPDSDKVRRVVDPDTIVGWRPAPGAEIPGRPNWLLAEKLAPGGFGDVWRAEHKKTREQRVYKFCYDSGRLRGLKREVTLVRLLKEELGDRRDIARILDWNFDEVPFFIESEWTEGGSLVQWLEEQGGASAVAPGIRIEIVAQVAEALAAAHSVGVLHKDVKPANILMTRDEDGRPRAMLTDFGIGLLADTERLERAGITVMSFTEIADPDELLSAAGTRLYMAPELMEGKPATVHADVYALGVMLYQLVIGDLSRALGPGWEREVEDPLVREDIAAAVDGTPERRISVQRLGERLRALDTRREERQLEALARARDERARRRRTWLGLSAGAFALVAVATGIQLRRVALEARRANREAETSRRVTEFIVELFRLADPGEARGNTVTAREILDQGARRIESGLTGQPEVQAALMATMGNVYLGLGLADQARPLLEKSLETRRGLFGESSLEVAEGRKLLGDVAWSQGDFEASERHYLAAVEARTRVLGATDPAVAEALVGVTDARWRQGDYEGASEVGERAVAIYRAAARPPAELANALSSLARVRFTAAHFAEAEKLWREALDLVQAEEGSADRRAAQMMNNLGMALTAQRRYDEASRYARDALAHYRRLLGKEHPLVATSASALALLHQQQGRLREAETLHREALAIFETRHGREHPVTGGQMTTLAWVLADQGRYGEAESLVRTARGILDRTLPEGHWAIAQAESVLGECLARRGLDREAEPMLLESYEIIRQTQGGLWEAAALRRIIGLYERRGDEAKVRQYRARLPGAG